MGDKDDPSKGASPKGAQAPISATPNGTTQVVGGYSKKQRRDDIVALMRKDLAVPAVYRSEIFTKYMPGYDAAKHQTDHYTTCVEFPQAVAMEWVKNYRFKGQDDPKFKAWVNRVGLGKPVAPKPKFIRQGFGALRESAKPASCWKRSGGAARPSPGDFYAIVNPVKTPKEGGTPEQQHTRGTGFCHVGVFISRGQPRKATRADLPFFKFEAQMKNGQAVFDGKTPKYIPELPDAELDQWLESTEVEDWVTADAGQGVGPSGQTAKLVKRLYQTANARITGEVSQEPGDRWLEAWLDIDEYENWPHFDTEVP